jgi:hypothetical protein
MEMLDPDFRDELTKAIVNLLVQEGAPVGLDASYYGWQADDWRALFDHVAKCKPDYDKCSWKDSYWSEFQGTFYEGDCTVNGISMRFTCACGHIKDREWRITSSYGELLRKLTQ